MPWEYKNYGNVEKGLLRYAMRGLLPDEILWRKKSPYPKTHNPAYLAAVSEALGKVERAEDALRGMGFSDLRVRLKGENAVLQLPDTQLARAFALRETITERLKPDFGSILLDLEGRR